MQPATCMGTIQEKVLAYGLGDDGYGIVYLQEDFRMYETCMGKEKHQRSVAKTTLIPTFNEDGFIWKVGGYTAITGGYTKKSKGTKKTACFLQAMTETEQGIGNYKTASFINKQAFILGEIQQDLFLMYSYLDHSFATWNSVSNRFQLVNLQSKGSNFKRHKQAEGIQPRDITAKVQSVLQDKDVKYKTLALHPGCFNNSFPYLIAVTKQDKILIKQFQLTEGYSKPIALDEQKPGYNAFEVIWTKEGNLVTFQVMRNREQPQAQSQQLDNSTEKQVGKSFKRDASPFHSQVLGSDVDDFEYDDDEQGAPNAKYCIQKEEYPPELLRAFDIV